MALTLPSPMTKVNFADSTKDPKQARSELAANVDLFNALLIALGGLDGVYLPLVGGTLLGNLTLQNDAGAGRQVRFVDGDGILRGRLSLDADGSSPQLLRYRFFDTDGATVLAEMTFGSDGIVYAVGGSTVLTLAGSAITVAPGVPLKVGASGLEVYSADNPPPATGGWEDVRAITQTSGVSAIATICDPTVGKMEAGYDYRIRLLKPLRRSSGGSAHLDFQLGSGSSTVAWNTASYDGSVAGGTGAGVFLGGGMDNDPCRLTGNMQVGSGASHGFLGDIIIRNPMSSSAATEIWMDVTQLDQPSGFSMRAVSHSASADTSCRFVLAASTLDAVSLVLQRQPIPGSSL